MVSRHLLAQGVRLLAATLFLLFLSACVAGPAPNGAESTRERSQSGHAPTESNQARTSEAASTSDTAEEPQFAPEELAAIGEIDMAFENIHPSFWFGGSSRTSERFFASFFIDLRFTNGGRSQVESIRIYDVYDRWWALDPEEDYDAEDELLGGWDRLVDVSLSENGSVLTSVDYRLEIDFGEHGTLSRTFDVPAPGKDSPEGLFYYTEDYKGSVSDRYVPALRRATIESVQASNDSLEIVLKPVDPRASNAEVVFMSEEGDFIAATGWLVNRYSREVNPALNDGNALRSENGSNVIGLKLSELDTTEEHGVQDIRYFYVTLTDGKQYTATRDAGGYHHLSHSKLYDLRLERLGRNVTIR